MSSSTDLRERPGLHRWKQAAPGRERGRSAVSRKVPELQRAYPIDVQALAEGHLAEGERRIRTGAAQEAVACFETALALRPGDRRAFLNLAQALVDCGRADQAELALRALLGVHPEEPSAAHLLGVILAQRDELAEGALWLRRSAEGQPEHARVFRDLAVVELFAGDLEASQTHLQRALELDPQTQDVLLSLVNVTDMSEDTPRVRLLRSTLSDLSKTSDRLSADSRIQVEFALAKACEDRGESRKAFDWLRRANASQRALLAYDADATEARLQRVEALFDRPLFDRLAGEGDPTDRPIFIVGMPRSGTTLVEQIISAHSRVQGAGETTALLGLIQQARGPRGEVWPEWAPGMNGDDCRNLAQGYLGRLPALAADRSRTTDKRLDNFEHVGLIHLMTPHAPIIRLVRDPRDVIVSCFALRFSNNQEWSYDLDEIVRFWSAYERLMDHWEAVLPPGRILSVSYEALVADTETEGRRILAHCGLDWEEGCRTFHTSRRPVRTASAAQVRRPIYDTSIGRWRRFETEMAPWFSAMEATGRLPTKD